MYASCRALLLAVVVGWACCTVVAQPITTSRLFERACLSLNYAQAQALLQDFEPTQRPLYANHLQFLQAVIGGDPASTATYLVASQELINRLAQQPASAQAVAWLAQLHFQRGALLVAGASLWGGAWELRRAYQHTLRLQELWPGNSALDALRGLFLIAFSAVPQDYKWFAEVLGYKGNLQQGLKLLHQARSTGYFTQEPLLVEYFARRLVMNDAPAADRLLDTLLQAEPDNRLAMYFRATRRLEQRLPAQAVDLLLPLQPLVARFPLVAHALGRAQLLQGNYSNSRGALDAFLATPGNLFHADALLKKAYSYLMEGNLPAASKEMGKILTLPESSFDEDKYAYREAQRYRHKPYTLAEVALLHARLAYDGGNNALALSLLNQLEPNSAQLSADERLELAYRRGRAYQAQGLLPLANVNYRLATQQQRVSKGWMQAQAYYYLGEIAEQQAQWQQARLYYEAALAVPAQEYRLGMEQKAKAGLARLKLHNPKE